MTMTFIKDVPYSCSARRLFRVLSALSLFALSLLALSFPAISQETGWPRTIVHDAGELVLPQKPAKVVSTALSVTGTLLAIDAPVTATAATTPNSMTDDKGFFLQWAAVADERGVEVLYPGLRFDLEAILAADPDLVIVSTSGADSALSHYSQLVELGIPTMVVNYSDRTWQELARDLAYALGLEGEADVVIRDFDAYAEEARSRVRSPEGGVSIVSFNGSSSDTAVGKLTGPHARVFEALGIEVLEAPSELDASVQQRADFAFVTLENVSAAVRGSAVFLVSGTQASVDAFLQEPSLANLPAVAARQVFPLGPSSFRIDYYSGIELIDTLVSILD